jgi:hypothetical protein
MKRCFPWPAPFSPQAPPKIALLCSSGSSILWRGPTPPERPRLPCGFVPSQTGLAPLRAKALQRSPGSCACCFSACAGSKTTQDRWLARDYREPSWCLPPSGESRRPGFAFFDAQYPAHRYPCLRFKPHLAMSPARLGAKMGRFLLSCRTLSFLGWVEDWRDTPKVQAIRCSPFPLGVPH